jgi:DNA-binding protein HU-beta
MKEIQMNQAELFNEIAANVANFGTPKIHVKNVLDALAKVAKAELGKGGEVTIPGIGKLTVKKTAARTGRNPRTGESVEIPAKNKPVFTAIKALKDAVNEPQH